MARPIALLALVASLAGCGPADTTGNEDLASPTPDLAMSDSGGGGGCAPKCSGLAPFCNATNHCVACLKDGDCAMGSYCKIVSDAIATCTPGCMSDDRCPNGQKCCGNQCVDPQTDVKNCGGCGMGCMAVHSAASCAGGQCMAGKCDSGWGDCNKDGMDGCEANLHSDVANCTGCGMVCNIPNAFAGCSDGCYATACKFGFDDCNLNGNDGCETSVLNDKNNCGGCGKPCLALPNASANCTNGSCLLGNCNFGYANCDGNPMNGCEVRVDNDAKNCGGCGNACPMGNICVQNACTCPMCNIPGASAKCINNMCVFDKCNPGFADCNNNIADGCEVNLNNDSKNCAQCGKSCNNLVCLSGMCTVFRPNVLLCGGSARSPMTFFPMGTNFVLMNSCTPDNNTQAIFITRGGAAMINAQTMSAYVNGGGIVLTEYNISHTVWTAVFGQNTAQGARLGSCNDLIPSTVQFTPNDPFWQDNMFMMVPLNTTGCGYAVQGYPGIITLAGWDMVNAAIGYRVLGQGRVWATDYDWQDNQGVDFTYSGKLMGYMMTHR